MSKRSERKERADKRRAEIAEELRQYMVRVLETTKGGANAKWSTALEDTEVWIRTRIRMFPQEAHMYRAGARILQDRIIKAMNWSKYGILRKPE